MFAQRCPRTESARPEPSSSAAAGPEPGGRRLLPPCPPQRKPAACKPGICTGHRKRRAQDMPVITSDTRQHRRGDQSNLIGVGTGSAQNTSRAPPAHPLWAVSAFYNATGSSVVSRRRLLPAPANPENDANTGRACASITHRILDKNRPPARRPKLPNDFHCVRRP